MEGSEDEPSEDNGGSDTAFARQYEDTEPEEESLLGRSVAAASRRSARLSWSSRSRETGPDEEEPSFENYSVASQASLQTSSRRSLRRENSMSYHHQAAKRYENNSEEDFELDYSSDGDERHRWQAMSSEEGITDEEGADQTVIETSCDDTSFNTSICSYKETCSSSELSVDPVVWKKFKFLSSILKETQHNLRAMDDLILEHHRLQGQPAALPQTSHALHQGLGEGEPKTDEAKLEEILSLLHHLTHTLSSYEQHPLLASALHVQSGEPSFRPDAPVSQQQQVLGTSSYANGTVGNATIALHHPSSYGALVPLPQHRHPYPHGLPLHQSPSHDKNTKLPESPEGKNITVTTSLSHSTRTCGKDGETCSNDFKQTLHISPDTTPADARLLLHPRQESTSHVYSHASPRYSSDIKNVDHVSESQPSAAEVTRMPKRDTVSQTDPFLFVSRVSNEPPSLHNAFPCQSFLPESTQGQEVPHHPLMNETRSLRKEIDDIVIRKQALDSRLQSLIAHRAMQRELEAAHLDEPKKRLTPLTKSKSLEDGELRRSKSKHRKYKARSKSCEEEGHLKRKTSSQETYLSMIDENQDEFPSLTMGSLNNDDRITELLTDEADIPGLGDSGLSSEINSINATIQELVRENQQLHKFLQGMTSESILKVDQEKLALEAKLQSLDKENKSLLITLDENQDSRQERTKASKGVKFCIDEQNERTEMSDKETKETSWNKLKDKDESGQSSQVQTQPSLTEDFAHRTVETRGGQPVPSVAEPVKKPPQFSFELDTDSQNTQKNQLLGNTINKERNAENSWEDSSKGVKFQSTNEEVSVSCVGESLTDNASTLKEVERLQQKILKLTEEREILEYKLSKEASERDFESTRLEARINILNDLNQTLTQKLQSADHQTITRKIQTSCQTDTVDSKFLTAYDREREREPDHTSTSHSKAITVTELGQTTTVPQHASSADKLVATSASKTSFILSSNIPLSSITAKRVEESYANTSGKSVFSPAMEEPLASRPHLKDLPQSVLSSDENISTDDDKISLIRTPREDTQVSQQSETPGVGVTELHTASDTPGEVRLSSEASGRRGSGTEPVVGITRKEEFHDKHFQVQQLEALVTQNKVIANNLNELKLMSKASESNRESAFIKIMEENVKVMQSVGEKLASGALPGFSTEPDGTVTELAQENQDLKSTLQRQQKRIEILINQNSSLEKKLHAAHCKSKEEEEGSGSLSGSDATQISDDETLSKGETQTEKNGKITKKDTSMNSLCNRKQREIIETSKVALTERRQLSKPSHTSHQPPSMYVDHSAETTIPPDQVGSSSSPQRDSSLLNGSSESSRRDSLGMKCDAVKDRKKRSWEVLDPDTQRLLDAALSKEKENRTRLLQEAERDREALQERIITLVQENDCLAARLEEVVSVSRNLSGHVHSVKDQLVKVEAEKNNLHKKVRSLEDGRDDSSVSLSDSIGSSHLTQRLKERIHKLQDEVERGWQEAHKRTVERDKAVAEKESLEYTSSIAINTARREAEGLRGQLAALQEDKDRRSLEHTNLLNELERKCVIAKAAQESQATHLEKLVEAERKITLVQNELKKVEEQRLKEEQARKSAEAELEEMRARKKVLPQGEAGGDKATQGEDQRWANTVAHLRSLLHQEQLRAQLLEAGEQESNGRLLTLQRDVRDAREANQQLQDKYNQLRAAYRQKKAEKNQQRELSQSYTSQVKELSKTTSDLEENLKAMLCALGESIEVTVELLASHVFLTPCLIHPGLTLHQDPEAWFGAQQGRLRWLQSQLRKLCLHNWKTGNLPRTSNLVSTTFEHSSRDSQVVVTKSHMKEDTGPRQTPQSCKTKHSRVMVDSLSDLSILDESRSYATTSMRRRSSASDITFSSASSPTKLGREIKHSTPKHKSHFREVNLSSGVRQGSVYLNEAERILSNQQKKLAETRHKQYKILIHSLQQDLDKSMVPSPSIPSSMFTTPERKVPKPQDMTAENSEDSLDSELLHMDARSSYASSPSSTPSTPTESSLTIRSHSRNSVKDMPLPCEESKDSHREETKYCAKRQVTIDTTGNSTSSSPSPSPRFCVKPAMYEKDSTARQEDAQQGTSSLKEQQQSCDQDVEKDRDSWEAEEDLIRMLVHSEAPGPQECEM